MEPMWLWYVAITLAVLANSWVVWRRSREELKPDVRAKGDTEETSAKDISSPPGHSIPKALCPRCGTWVPPEFIEEVSIGGIFDNKFAKKPTVLVACRHCLYDENYPEGTDIPQENPKP
jgi:hypothetical protein